MGQINKITITFLLFIFSFFYGYSAGKNDLPDDPIAIELWIQVHKNMKKAEKSATEDLAVIEGEHIATQSFSSKFHKTRTALNKRMADAGSYLTLASRILSLGLQVKEVWEDYSDFMETTYNNALDHPYLALICFQAHKQLKKELQNLATATTSAALLQTNVLKATMQEKHQFLNIISSRLVNIRMIISSAQRRVNRCVRGNVSEFIYRDFVKSGAYDNIMDKIKKRWDDHTKKS
ncbi:MAG: hypothetical protein NC095_09745 [Muribaculum sp.]|nr:hypothetical protein [Muribaculum sp.]